MMRAVLHRLLLRAGAIFVPASGRAEWMREWTAELWHIEHRASPVAHRAVTAFCLGAVRDGLSLGRQHGRFEPRSLLAAGSAGRCLLLMALLCAASYTTAHLSANVRAHRQPIFRGFRQHIVFIRGQRSNDPATPTIEPEQVQLWRLRHQQIFDSFAFYQLLPDTALALASASPNLFDILGVPLHSTGTQGQHGNLPSAILSHELWVHRFASDPLVGGKPIDLGSHRVVVRGVAPAGLRPLPGNVDAWLLTPDTADVTPQPGFLIAHIAPAQGATLWKGGGMFSSHLPDGSVGEFFCTALEDTLPRPDLVFLFNVMIASLALPAITSLSLGEYRLRTRRRVSASRLCRWSFLAAKLAFLLPAVYLLSLDLAYLPASLPATVADALQRTSCFALCLFGLRWVLNDQRRRCPVCLSRLRHAARVGHPSHTFLAWNGTELACTGGHGLLHVPELPTSWFGTQRWLQLDSSWQVLFPKSTA